MPLVISHHAKRTFHVRNDEVLGEILGHSNFDGEDWAVGDEVVFEDGTGAAIKKKDQFHVWSDPEPVQLSDALAMIRSYGDPRVGPDEEIDSFAKLFEKLSSSPSKKSWWQKIFAR